jgi:uncharacterized membrane protein
MRDIDTLGGPLNHVNSLNNAGQVVGDAMLSLDENLNSINHAFLWSQAGGMQDLTPNANFSSAYGINAAGQVVGYADMPGFLGLFLWSQSSGFIKITDHIPANSGWTLSSVNGINDAGQILGSGTNPAGKEHAFLLTPVPAANVSGMITLESIVPTATPQSLTLTFRPADNSGDIVKNVSVGSNGAFSVTGIPRKAYTLHIKGSKWLAKNVAVNASNGDVANVNATLLGGDADNNNLVDVEDLAVLIASFDAAPSDPNWNNGKADFDCNDIVDVEDLALLIRNFDADGDA